MELHRSARAKHRKLMEGDPSTIGNRLICWPVAFIACKGLVLQTLWRASKFHGSQVIVTMLIFLMGHQ